MLEADQEHVVFSAASLEFFDFLETLVVSQTELLKFSLESSNGLFELSLIVGELLNLNGQLVDLKSELGDLLILLLDGGLEGLDGSQEFFNLSLESVDFSFVLSASDFEHAQLVDQLVLLEQLVAELFDGALLLQQVLLELTDLALQGFNLSALADQVLKLSGSQNEANSIVFVLSLEGLDLSVTLRKNNLELVELDREFLELSKQSLSFFEQQLVLVLDILLGALDTFEFFLAANLVEFEFVSQTDQFIVVLNVDDLFDLLGSSITEFNEFFSEGLVVSFQNLNALS